MFVSADLSASTLSSHSQVSQGTLTQSTLTQSTPPIPTSPTKHQNNFGHKYKHNLSAADDGASSTEWALSRSQAQFYRTPYVYSPASMGREALERQSLLGHGTDYSYHSTSIND